MSKAIADMIIMTDCTTTASITILEWWLERLWWLMMTLHANRLKYAITLDNAGRNNNAIKMIFIDIRRLMSMNEFPIK